jgi:hypothetical protein
MVILMKLVGLVLVILFPIALAAQERDPSQMKNQSATSAAAQAAAQANVSTAGDEADSAPTDWSADLASDTNTNAPQQANAKPSQTTPPPGQTRPKIPGSMVGYIDNAIVASQIRIRFEAAFHDNFPDRAEFFYSQYAGLSGPGPNSVVADLNFLQLYLYGEYAPIKRFSFFTQVPVRWIQPQLTVANENQVYPPFPNVNEAGLSDVAAGFKLAAVASSNQYLTFQFQAYFPSGSASEGLGTNHYSVEPALLYYRRLSDRAALEAQVGDSHPIGGSTCLPCNTTPMETLPKSEGFAGDIFFYGVGPSYVLYRDENVWIAPVIELVGWRVLGGLETNCLSGLLPNGMPNSCANQVGVPASGTNIVNAKLGARTAVGAHSSFYIGYGHQLTHAVWYKEIVRAEYRYSF